MSCTEVRGQLQLLVVDVDGNDLLGSEGHSHLHDVEADPADGNDCDGLSHSQLRYILDGPKAGEDTASQHRRLGRANRVGKHEDISVWYHAVLSQAAHGIHGDRLTALTGQPRLAVVQDTVEPIVAKEGLTQIIMPSHAM